MKLCTKKSMSLIELMLTVVILSIGIIMVARSFLTVTNALSYTQNKILATEFLDSKIAEFREMGYSQSEFLEEDFFGTVKLGNKEFSWETDFSSVYVSEEEDIDGLWEISLRVIWKEAGRDKDQKMGSYLRVKK